MMTPNIVTKFQNVDIFLNCCVIFDLSSAHACRLESVKDNAEADISCLESAVGFLTLRSYTYSKEFPQEHRRGPLGNYKVSTKILTISARRDLYAADMLNILPQISKLLNFSNVFGFVMTNTFKQVQTCLILLIILKTGYEICDRITEN